MDYQQNDFNGGRNLIYNTDFYSQTPVTQKQEKSKAYEQQRSWRNRDHIKEAWSYKRNNSNQILSQNNHSSIEEFEKHNSASNTSNAVKLVEQRNQTKISKEIELSNKRNSKQNQIKINKNNLAGK